MSTVAKIVIAVELNRGRPKTHLREMGAICTNLNKFLTSAAKDLGIMGAEFKASDFRNASLQFKTEFDGVGEEKKNAYVSQIKQLVHYHPGTHGWRGLLSAESLSHYASITEPLHSNGTLEIALQDPANDESWEELEWLSLKRSQAQEVLESITKKASYYGGVVGAIHALFKEVSDPHFSIRDHVSGKLITCYYSESQYSDVANLLKDRNAKVHISGIICFNRVKGEIESVNCERLEQLPSFEKLPREFLKPFPGITGDLSTEEFIKKIRDD